MKTINQSELKMHTRALPACMQDDLVLNSGVCALVEGRQIAIFAIPGKDGILKLFACDNYDPFGKANVLSRGLICSIGTEIFICSPLYKQHFSLIDGHCLEDEQVSINVYRAELEANNVVLHLPVSEDHQVPVA